MSRGRPPHAAPRGESLPLGSPQLAKLADYTAKLVVRGGVEPPTFRFSGLRIIMQDWPRKSLCLLSGMRCTLIDAGARGCMTRNETAQFGSRPLVVTPDVRCKSRPWACC